MLGGDWLEPYVLAALGMKQSVVGQQYLGTLIQSENRKLKPAVFFQPLLAKFLLLQKCQGKRLLLGELCTFSSCIQLCIACSSPQLLRRLLLQSCSCHNCEPSSFLPNKGSPRKSQHLHSLHLPSAFIHTRASVPGVGGGQPYASVPGSLLTYQAIAGTCSLGYISACTLAHSHNRACMVAELGLESVFMNSHNRNCGQSQ